MGATIKHLLPLAALWSLFPALALSQATPFTAQAAPGPDSIFPSIFGSSFDVQSSRYIGNPTSLGVFTNGPPGFGTGVILSTGLAQNAMLGNTPNGTVPIMTGQYCPDGFNYASLGLTFTPTVTQTIQFTLLFATYEDPNCLTTAPDTMGMVLLPSGTQVVSQNSQDPSVIATNTRMSYTRQGSRMSYSLSATAGQNYQMAFYVCNGGDTEYDSALLFNALLLPTSTSPATPVSTPVSTPSNTPSVSSTPGSTPTSTPSNTPNVSSTPNSTPGSTPGSTTSTTGIIAIASGSVSPVASTNSTPNPTSTPDSTGTPSSIGTTGTATTGIVAIASASVSSTGQASSTTKTGTATETVSTSSTTNSISDNLSLGSTSTTESSSTAPSVPSAMATTTQSSSTIPISSSAATNIPELSNYKFAGCLGSKLGYPGFSEVGKDAKMVPSLCLSMGAGHKYIGVVNDTCYASDTLDNTALVGTGQCNIRCPGDDTLFCGGFVDTSSSQKMRRSSGNYERDAPANVLLTLYTAVGDETITEAVATETVTVPGGTEIETVVVTNTEEIWITTITYTTIDAAHPTSLIITEFCTSYCPVCREPHRATVQMATITMPCHVCGEHGESNVVLTVPTAVLNNAAQTLVENPYGAGGALPTEYVGNDHVVHNIPNEDTSVESQGGQGKDTNQQYQSPQIGAGESSGLNADLKSSEQDIDGSYEDMMNSGHQSGPTNSGSEEESSGSGLKGEDNLAPESNTASFNSGTEGSQSGSQEGYVVPETKAESPNSDSNGSGSNSEAKEAPGNSSGSESEVQQSYDTLVNGPSSFTALPKTGQGIRPESTGLPVAIEQSRGSICTTTDIGLLIGFSLVALMITL